MDNVQKIKTQTVNWPDYSFSAKGLEELLFIEKFLQAWETSVNVKHKISEREKSSRNSEDTFSSNWNFKILDNFNPNFSFNINQNQEHTYDPQKADYILKTTKQSYNISAQISFRVAKDFQLRPNLSYKEENMFNGLPQKDFLNSDIRNYGAEFATTYDINLPKEFKLPFVKNAIPAGNRITINSGLRYSRVDSAKTASNNSDTFSINASTRFDTSRYLSVSLDTGASYFLDRQPDKEPQKNDSRFEANLAGRVTLRF